MDVDVHPSIWIRRPREDVAAFMFDPLNDTKWLGGAVSSRPDQPGLLETGHTFHRVVRFLGRSWESTYVVTSSAADHYVEMQTEWPFPTLVRYELTRGSDGTAVAIRSTGRPGRFFGVFSPILNRWVHRVLSADLARLKAILER